LHCVALYLYARFILCDVFLFAKSPARKIETQRKMAEGRERECERERARVCARAHARERMKERETDRDGERGGYIETVCAREREINREAIERERECARAREGQRGCVCARARERERARARESEI